MSGVHRWWLDLDGLLAQLWESHAIRTKVLYAAEVLHKNFVTFLLPEITERRAIELVTYANLDY